MPIGTTTLEIYSNSGLTTIFGSSKVLSHNADLSGEPKVFTMWIGSNASDRIFYASSAPAVDNIVISVVDSLPEWQASHTYTLGQSVEPTVGNGLRYECTTAGTSGASQPTWPTGAIGSIVTDGTVVWTLKAASHPISEVKLASTEAGLASAIAGASLSLGTSISSGVAGAKPVWVQVTNTVTTVSNNSGTPEIELQINSVDEEVAP